MRVIDMHCDVLYKMLKNEGVSFHDETVLDVTYKRLKQANVMMQSFAIFLPPNSIESTKQALLRSVDLFYSKVLKCPNMVLIQNQRELRNVTAAQEKIGAFLSLEGVDGLQGDLTLLRTLYRLGLRSVGLTWNHANWAADGVGESRGAGFTERGKALIRECEELKLIIDVSHLSERAFWELTDLAQRPFMASHSNAYQVCPHPRNLSDDQIKALISMNGRIGVTFVPQFVKQSDDVSMKDMLHHIDHICALGGEKHIGFGSDFDGIDRWIRGLENTLSYPMLENLLLKHYDSTTVEGFLWKNWNLFYLDNLPK